MGRSLAAAAALVAFAAIQHSASAVKEACSRQGTSWPSRRASTASSPERADRHGAVREAARARREGRPKRAPDACAEHREHWLEGSTWTCEGAVEEGGQGMSVLFYGGAHTPKMRISGEAHDIRLEESEGGEMVAKADAGEFHLAGTEEGACVLVASYAHSTLRCALSGMHGRSASESFAEVEGLADAAVGRGRGCGELSRSWLADSRWVCELAQAGEGFHAHRDVHFHGGDGEPSVSIDGEEHRVFLLEAAGGLRTAKTDAGEFSLLDTASGSCRLLARGFGNRPEQTCRPSRRAPARQTL
mmetsp:Transcript_118311/g.342037  ORF Transcript_118311/g.342037 Transcript_118311/m.342037 type:complete len:302 (+) Transcript_118311:54-959(+)|eukprot:CAMPEP_0176081538 /NCGR_PEP_ID=MMETSP0120_2-20121206/40787_1 /TAXON_ID=160619 /ORGANISM="Kryptoperidinium foliaceum, Strain CCMP 1326" /LENGTH=301 /DNA_ID=CAMNT_0017415307 /DNA_START=54 /DNA_END=959 /DNA_ORIENTATION=+